MSFRQAVLLAGQFDDRAAFGRLVGQRGHQGRSASSARLTPGAGMNLGRHAVAVGDGAGLVEQQVSTSPAASTARPEVASTLTWSSRSMPAMPMADSRPPMVVGIRQMNSAPSTVIGSSLTARIRWPKAQQGDGGDQEDQGQAGQQHGQRDLVGRLAALGALDHGDHAVEEAVARDWR
jgi:hypothetical protein